MTDYMIWAAFFAAGVITGLGVFAIWLSYVWSKL